MSLLAPVGILLATGVTRFAPMASGSGIPQVLYAAILARKSVHHPLEDQLLSIKTALVKALSTGIGFISGASIGIEGPMVQISAAVFTAVGRVMKKKFPRIDFQSYVVAGAGTGFAAVFNAPLGGITFALEEVVVGDFGRLRHLVLVAVIVSGLTAQALIGNESYFGSPLLGAYSSSLIRCALLIGILGGILGGLFGRIVTSDFLRAFGRRWWIRALFFGSLVGVIGYYYSGKAGGSNYSITREFFSTGVASLPLSFPIAKLLATAFSALSGIGGGILAPSMSIGAWMGISAAKLAMFPNLKVCALLGMVAYFSGTFQIPITAVIVVMEITHQYDIIFPMMIAALCAFLIAKLIMPESLYHVLIHKNFTHTETSDAIEIPG